MSDYEITAGATSRRIAVWLADSSSTVGAGLTGLVFNSAGLTCYYWREDEGNAGATAVTLATATRGTFTSSGFIEKDATNTPGLYEFGIPNAAIATGAKWVKVMFKGATNLAQRVVTIKLVSLDMDTALSSQTVGTATAVTTVNGLAANVITAASIAADAITDAKVASDVTIASVTGAVGSVTATVNANVTQISGDSTAADNLEQAYDDAAGAVPWHGVFDQGTAQSASATGVVLRAAAAFADDVLIGCQISVFGSTQGYWQHREILDNALTGDSVTVDTWTVTPTGTITYKIWPGLPAPSTPPAVNVTQLSGDTAAADNAEAFFDGTGYAGTGNVIPTVTTLTNLPAITAGWLTATGIAADAITAAKLAADVATELQSGLATAASITTLSALVDDLEGRLTAARAGYLDNLSAGAAALQASVDDLEGRLTAARAGYLDNLSGGAVALNSDMATLLAAAEVYKKNVAVTRFKFPMRGSDGSAATGKTVTGTYSGDNNNFAAITGAITERGSGWYEVSLLQAETNYDELALNFTASGCVPTMVKIRTQS